MSGRPARHRKEERLQSHSSRSTSPLVAPDLRSWKAALLREEAAFEKLKRQLLKTHPGQFVAIKGGQVLDADTDELELGRRIRRNYPDVAVLITEVTQSPRVFHLRSPRLVR